MIPRTFPSTYETTNGTSRMVVYFITDLTGLDRWIDYIPVKFAQLESQEDNTYNNNGVHLVDPLSSTSGKQAWVDYIPVYADPNAADAWFVSAQGYIPVGYANKPSFSLDFTSTAETLDPRITFSRGSLATRTNSDGLIEYAPHNLLTYSEQFDNAAWSKSATTISANTASSPNGTTTADKLVETTANSSHFVTVASAPSTAASMSISGSIYVKASERTFCRLRLYDNVGLIRSAAVNLSTGVITFENGTGTTNVTSVGNGWYRIAITGTTASTATSANIDLYLRSDISTESYTGDGTSGLFIWGAQLNVGALQPYYPTTTAAYYGPRFDYDPVTLAPKGLLIEEQRTNLLLRSEEFSVGATWNTNVSSVTVVDDSITSPDGLVTGSLVTDNSNDSVHAISQSITLSTSTSYSASVFLKAGTATYAGISIRSNSSTDFHGIVCNLSNGTITQTNTQDFTSVSSSITSVGNGWYKVTITGTSPSSISGSNFIIYSSNTGTPSTFTGGVPRYIGTGSTFYVWGAQLEAGTFATSYIPTTSAQVTRAADVASVTGTNFSSWYNQNEGTIYVDAVVSPNLTNFPSLFSVSDGTSANRLSHYLYTSGFYGNIVSGGVNQGDPSRLVSPVAGASYKVALGVAVNNAIIAANGSVGTADTSILMPVGVNQARIGTNQAGAAVSNTTIKKIAYYPVRLTNAQLQALTA